MNPRTNLLILILSAIAGIIGFVLMSISNSEIGPKLALGGSAVSQLAAIIYLWPSSTITQKKIWKFMIGAVVLTTMELSHIIIPLNLVLHFPLLAISR